MASCISSHKDILWITMDLKLLIMDTVITSKGLGKLWYKKKYFRRHVGTGIKRTKAIIGQQSPGSLMSKLSDNYYYITRIIIRISHQIGPLGRFGLVVAMSVRSSDICCCPLPMQFFCWNSERMLPPTTCHLPHVMYNFFLNFLFFGKSGGISWWRVFYQCTMGNGWTPY